MRYKESAYAAKLRDPRWQKMRLEVLSRDNWMCRECESTDKTLHVHHLCYLPDHDPWEYQLLDLKTLCEDCHEEETQSLREAHALLLYNMSISRLDSHQIYNLADTLLCFVVHDDIAIEEWLQAPHKDSGRQAIRGWCKTVVRAKVRQ